MQLHIIVSLMYCFLFTNAFQAPPDFIADVPNPTFLEDVLQTHWDWGVVEEHFADNAYQYFDRYYTYPDAHISIKRGEKQTSPAQYEIIGAIENIVFDAPSISLQDIQQKYGAPSFENSTLGVIGYETNDYSIFFINSDTTSEISVYRADHHYDPSVVEDMIHTLEQSPYSHEHFQDCIETLVTQWGDGYDVKFDGGLRYTERRGKSGILYGSQGIALEGNNESYTLNIYSNFIDYANLKNKYAHSAHLQFIDDDYTFVQEQARLQEKQLLEETMALEGSFSPDKKHCVLPNKDGERCFLWGLFIIDTQDSKKNKEIPIPYVMDSYNPILWLDERFFVFAPFLSGVYMCDIQEGSITLVQPGLGKTGDIKMLSAENGELTLEIQYTYPDEGHQNALKTIPYWLDGDGKIVFAK